MPSPTLQLAACALLATLAAAQPSAPPADPASLATIEGTVLGAHHFPLADASVLLVGVSANNLITPQGEAPHIVITNTLGKFSFQDLHPGRYVMQTVHDGYNGPNQVFPLPTVTLAAGQHLKDLSIELVPMPVLSGKVTDEDGNPMPGVTVRPMRAAIVVNGRSRIANAGTGTDTGPDGTWDLTVPGGRTWLSFRVPKPKAPVTPVSSAPGEPEQAYVVTYYPGVGDLSLASPIDAASEPVPALNVRLHKAPVYHVRGKVTGDLLPDLRIVVSQVTGNASPSIIDEGHPVKDDGTFDITGLTRGEWTLNIRQYGKLISMGLRTVRIGETNIDDFTIPIQQPGSLTVSVKTIAKRQAGSDPIPESDRWPQFGLKPLDSMLNEAWLDPNQRKLKSDSEFTLKDIEAGRYRVEVNPPSGGYVKSVMFDGRDCMDSGVDLSAAPPANLPDQPRLQITISMTAGRITGNVTNPNGAPPSGAVVTLIPNGPPASVYRPDLNPVVRTDAGGHFVVNNVAPGAYRAYAWEHLDPTALVLNGDTVAFGETSLPKLFDNMSVSITVAEDESKQLSLPLISAAAIDEQSHRLH